MVRSSFGKRERFFWLRSDFVGDPWIAVVTWQMVGLIPTIGII